MDNEMQDRHGSAGYPVDQPTQALRTDHQFVRTLFDRYLNTDNVDVKKQAGPQILMALEMHSRLEETVFYPRVRDTDPSLIGEFEDAHQQVDQMVAQLKTMDEGDPQCDALMQQLCDAVMRHVDTEEQQLFPKVEGAGLDMTALGLEMQAFEASIISGQARAMEQKDMRT